MSKFWELLEDSVIVQALVTLGLVMAVIYLTITEREVPDALLNLAIMALGYYFGSKAQMSGKQAARTVIKEFENGQGGAKKEL